MSGASAGAASLSNPAVCLEFYDSELRNSNIGQQVEALRKVQMVATVLGPDKTVDGLIPLLIQCEKANESVGEVLYTLAQECRVLADLVGGQDNFSSLLKLLFCLVNIDETAVREAASKSIIEIIELADLEHRQSLICQCLLPELKTLVASERFTVRVAACSLLPITYQYACSSQCNEESIRLMFTRLCTDETPMVKRAAATKMKDFFRVLQPGHYTDMLDTFKTLSQDETQDAVRISSLHAAIEISRLSLQNSQDHAVDNMAKIFALPLCKACAEDRSWKVRLELAKNFDQACSLFNAETLSAKLVPALVLLLQDFEQEVRVAAINIVEPCVAAKCFTNQQLLFDIIPCLTHLSYDSSQNVRAVLAPAISAVSVSVGAAATRKNLLSLVLDLMRDDIRDVRFSIVRHAGPICRVLGIEALEQKLMGTIKDLSSDPQWRVRLAVVELIPEVARQFGEDLSAQSKLEHMVVKALGDSVFAVREAGVKSTGLLAIAMDAQWTIDILIPRVADQYKSSSGCVHRMAPIHVLPEIAVALSEEQVAIHILPLLWQAIENRVSNVQLAGLQALVKLVQNHRLPDSTIKGSLKRRLAGVVVEAHSDVQQYFEKALSLCDAA